METIEMSEEAVADLRTAFQYNQYDTECYLDTEEGRVIWFSADSPRVDSEPDEEDPDWVREAYEKRMAVWTDEEGRYLELPPSDVTTACEDMVVFLEEHANDRFAERFEGAGRHRRVFESFRRAVEDDRQHRKTWQEFRRERVMARVEEWLELQGYRLVRTVAESSS